MNEFLDFEPMQFEHYVELIVFTDMMSYYIRDYGLSKQACNFLDHSNNQKYSFNLLNQIINN